MDKISTIIMGDDEFILYIRKHHPNCNQFSNILAKQISSWFKEHSIEPFKNNVPSKWDIIGKNIDPQILPKTAAMFEFDRNLLPKLFDKLDELGRKI